MNPLYDVGLLFSRKIKNVKTFLPRLLTYVILLEIGE
jgi:hypothetical protein